ncbi:hypothetical protein evm_006104 [Chilo suppressalis]|nr:hypothetical protein evm_006104 [Chilo suppressalis]
MYLKRSSTVKYFIAAFVGAALYCEWFVYVIQPQYWQGLGCDGQDAACTKVLFIADPQIQGDLAVPPPLSYLFNWDSDRYLKATFTVVSKYFQPDILVYMGDLMDEGSISTIPQFHGYVKRLSSIFNIESPVLQIWLPGDNDIGGENEPVSREKVAEFDKVFNQPSTITYSNITFYKVNGMTYTFPKNIQGADENNINIVVSHYPITTRTVFSMQLIKEIHPNIFFCAHDHESKYVTQNKDLTHRRTHSYGYGEAILNISLDEDTLYEVYVPTCSYRMGTSKIGFGAAILDDKNHLLRYTVFWSPTRFPYLLFYLAVLIFIVWYFILFCAARLIHRQPNILKSNSDVQPLLDRI